MCRLLFMRYLPVRSEGWGCGDPYDHEYPGAVYGAYFMDRICGSSFPGPLSYHFILPGFLGGNSGHIYRLFLRSNEQNVHVCMYILRLPRESAVP